MFVSVKNKTQRNTLIDLLKFIVAGTIGEFGFAFVPKVEGEKLHKAEPTFITLDASVTNEAGQIKAVATAAGIEAITQSGSETATTTTASATTDAAEEKQSALEPIKFEMGSMDAVPDINRRSSKESNYPFESLKSPEEMNGKFAFFFVPASETRPNPAKSLASTVASATKRFSKKDGRVFTIRKGEHGGKVGAFIVRTK